MKEFAENGLQNWKMFVENIKHLEFDDKLLSD